MGALISKIFPCTTTPDAEPGHVTITVQSTSACCRSEIRTFTVPGADALIFKDVIDALEKRYSGREITSV